MGRRGPRRRIATNVYDDASGRSIIYRDHDGKQREIRGTHATAISDLRKAVVAELERTSGSGRAVTARGTLAEAVDKWESLERHLASWKERRAELRAWVRELGDEQVRAITATDARRVMSQWAEAGIAPKTIRNRRWTLQHLYRVLYGPKTITPVDDVKPPPKTRTIPVMIDPAHVLQVYANLLTMERKGILHDAKTRARFMVRASTGKRPSEIMRAQPSDVNLQRREWRVRDGKGGWSEGLYLNDEMLAAWKVFVKADAWGSFRTGSMMNTLRSAGWQPHGDAFTRAYELRHSAGIALSDAGIDLSDISGFLGHTDLRTTRQTYVPIRRARMQRASEALEGRFGGWTVPAAVPASGVDSRGLTGGNVGTPAGTTKRPKQAVSSMKKGGK
jgi:integrase